MPIASRSAIFSLYRSYLRQVRLLPQDYLRQFFRIKGADDFKSIIETKNDPGLQGRKLKRVKKDLRKLKLALEGNVDAFEHILDVAYGRKGSLKWEIMKPLLKDPNAPLAPRIIPTVEKSRPPVYSPELTALLTSKHSRKKKNALDSTHMKTPPTLPKRADPSSEDARLLGPFSKRREVNIRWRFFKTECSKVLPPLQLSLAEESHSNVHGTDDPHAASQAGVRGVGLQGGSLLDGAMELAGPAWRAPSTPRRALQAPDRHISQTQDKPFQSELPARWLRKRYQNLLGKLPVLTYSLKSRYTVALAPSAVSSHLRYGANRLPPLDNSSLEWIKLADGKQERKSIGSKQKQDIAKQIVN